MGTGSSGGKVFERTQASQSHGVAAPIQDYSASDYQEASGGAWTVVVNVFRATRVRHTAMRWSDREAMCDISRMRDALSHTHTHNTHTHIHTHTNAALSYIHLMVVHCRSIKMRRDEMHTMFCSPSAACVPVTRYVVMGNYTHKESTLETGSVCFGLLRANSKVNSWHRMTVEIKERGSDPLQVRTPQARIDRSETRLCESSSTRASQVKFTVKNAI